MSSQVSSKVVVSTSGKSTVQAYGSKPRVVEVQVPGLQGASGNVGSVVYDQEQNLTAEEKVRARKNIDAASAEDLQTVISTATEAMSVAETAKNVVGDISAKVESLGALASKNKISPADLEAVFDLGVIE